MFLMGCQSLDVNLPAPRIESPESVGMKKFIIGGTVTGAGKFRATSNAGERPPNLTDTALAGALNVGPVGEYGITDHLSTGLEIDIGGANSSIFGQGRIKYQLMGSTWTKKETGPQLSIWVRGGSGSGSEEGNQKVEFGSGGYPWTGTITDTMIGSGISFGYRTSERTLLYTGFAADKHSLKAEINQSAATDNSDPGGTYSRTYSGKASALGLGVRFSWRIFALDIYSTYNTATFDDTAKATGVSGGIKFEWLLNAK